jgi:hypothetical protein
MTRKNRMTRLLIAGLVLVLSFPLMGVAVYNGDVHTHEHELQASLRGSAEAPGPGDPDGEGQANITLKMDDHQVCWEIEVKKIALPSTAAHIHFGSIGVPGPVVVPLSAPDAEGHSSGCRTVDHELHMNLHMHPEQYYVNVHNASFPGGAVRGQLVLEDD